MAPDVTRLIRRARLLFGRGRVERAMSAELEHHIECEIADRVRQGLSPDEARRTSLRDFGGVEAVKEHGRDARGIRSVEDAIADLGYACRVLRLNPGFTAAATLTFALGIGAATAIATLVYGVLLRPLPYRQPERLVVVWEHDVAHDRPQNVVSADTFEAWRDRSRSFAGMAAIVPTSATLDSGADSERVVGADVSPGYFEMLGIAPALGRDFRTADLPHGKAVILGDTLWKRRFGADPAVVGTTIRISGQPYEVVGVMPPTFDPPRLGWLGEQSLWFPLPLDATHRSWGRSLIVIGRLRPDVPLDQARSEMLAIARARAQEMPENRDWSATVVTLADQITGSVRVALVVLLGAVGLLLALAITNVGTLTLALVRRRGHELAVRRAIGATDRRLFAQMFWQSAALGTIGTVAGLLVASAGVRGLLRLMPPGVPRVSDIRLDLPVLVLMAAVATASTLVFATVVGLRGRAGIPIAGAVHDAGHPGLSARSGGRALVVTEIAIALALASISMLMVRSFIALRHVDLGFREQGVVIARIALPERAYPSAAGQRDFFARVLARVRAMPGVVSAGLISTRPFGGMSTATTVADPRAAKDRGSIVADVRYADAALFGALGIEMQSGGPFDEREPGPPGAVVSAGLARALWPGEAAVGHTIAVTLYDGITARVTGVAADVHLFDARTPARPAIYLSATRFTSTVRDLVVRVDREPESIVAPIRSAVAELEPGLPVYAVQTMSGLVDRSLAPDRFTTLLLSAFGLAALALSAIGIVGVVSGEIGARRREIGIRLALGSSPRGIVGLFLRHALARASIGIAAVLLALALARGMTTMVFGITAHDPASYVSVIAIVLAVSILSALAPTVRAIRRSPLDALRDG